MTMLVPVVVKQDSRGERSFGRHRDPRARGDRPAPPDRRALRPLHRAQREDYSADSERDHFFTPQEAVGYGPVDKVLQDR